MRYANIFLLKKKKPIHPKETWKRENRTKFKYKTESCTRYLQKESLKTNLMHGHAKIGANEF